LIRQKLFYKPGTQFGYTLGHRVAGWLLRDYWMQQPEGRRLGITNCQDTFKFLVFDPLGLSKETRFSHTLQHAFGFEGSAGDASIMSTGEDMMKLAVVALRKGQLPTGKVMISEVNWNKWAVPNLLPGGKMSKDLVSWEGSSASWSNWNVGGMKESIMQQSGDYGWNYFGATYNKSQEIGWCGFFSSCLRVSYLSGLAFVMMQRDVADLKKSKPYVIENFESIASFLRCPGASTCVRPGYPTVFCDVKGKKATLSTSCQQNATRGKGFSHPDFTVDEKKRACYVPACSPPAPSTWWGGGSSSSSSDRRRRWFR